MWKAVTTRIEKAVKADESVRENQELKELATDVLGRVYGWGGMNMLYEVFGIEKQATNRRSFGFYY